MGGAVSSGRDNDELIDNLIGGNYIRSQAVERVFRALDRGDYMSEEAREQAYKDLAWKNGLLHMSAPCIYSEVMEGLDLKPGLSFLNVGSGTGYLSTLVGLMIGSSGTNHGVEIYKSVTDYSNRRLHEFLENSPILDEFDFCEPKFYQVNALNLTPLQAQYDRVYCGAACPPEYQTYFQKLIKVGGVLVMPLNDNLVQVRRVKPEHWQSRSLLSVSFTTLRIPTKEEATDHVKLDDLSPARLQVLSRAAIRSQVRAGLLSRRPELRDSLPHRPPAKKPCPRRIRIPIDEDSDVEGLNALHDLDRESGANEMNALLSLVLSMGQNRGAGALRIDPDDSGSSEDSDDDDDDEDNYEDDDNQDQDLDESNEQSEEPSEPNDRHQGLLTFEIQDHSIDVSRESTPSPETPSKSTDSKSETASTSRSESKDTSSKDTSSKAGTEEPSKSEDSMEWDKNRDSEDEDDEESTREKRQKLDSGIGEENTTHTSVSSLDKTDSSKTDASESDASDSRRRSSGSISDEPEDVQRTGRRKKRSRCCVGTRSSSGSPRGSGTGPRAAGPARHKRQARDRTQRRLDLSTNMKRAVNCLPLPSQLRVYVNHDRAFQ